jgi:hypothetical protein
LFSFNCIYYIKGVEICQSLFYFFTLCIRPPSWCGFHGNCITFQTLF